MLLIEEIQTILSTILLLATPVFTTPVSTALRPRYTEASTDCGYGSDEDYYKSTQIQSAVNAACSYVTKGKHAGSSKYPEKYSDYEGFTFHGVSGPYYEFPILESGVYTGGEPGADRVVINGKCVYAGAITHTGASSYDGFVACSGTD